jgi:hypothetical protein
MSDAHLTERQRKWFDSIQSGLERDTGKSLEDWVKIALSCPESKPRARLKWFKDVHGLLQNRASYVISQAFPSQMAWVQTDALVAALWSDPGARAIYEALDAAAMSLEGAIRTPRKGYTAWARNFQFAAAKPAKGAVQLGLAVAAQTDPRLQPRGASVSWSERLLSRLVLSTAADVNEPLRALLRASWEKS